MYPFIRYDLTLGFKPAMPWKLASGCAYSFLNDFPRLMFGLSIRYYPKVSDASWIVKTQYMTSRCFFELLVICCG